MNISIQSKVKLTTSSRLGKTKTLDWMGFSVFFQWVKLQALETHNGVLKDNDLEMIWQCKICKKNVYGWVICYGQEEEKKKKFCVLIQVCFTRMFIISLPNLAKISCIFNGLCNILEGLWKIILDMEKSWGITLEGVWPSFRERREGISQFFLANEIPCIHMINVLIIGLLRR